MADTVKRATRVAGRLREEIAGAMRDLSDPRVQGVIVSRVEVTDDLQSAKIHVRKELGLLAEGDRKLLLKGLEAAAPRLRRDLAHRLALRYAPNLRFYYDEAPDDVLRIEELLREIGSESR